jgi:periplasmic protein TonB
MRQTLQSIEPMAFQKEHTNYLDALSRHNWGTWAWTAVIALAMNLTLFIIMPYLLHRQPTQPVYAQRVSHINVIRIKRSDSAVQRKPVKPPEPPQKQEEVPARQPLQPKLALPFQINPRLPGGPATLSLPDLPAMSLDPTGFDGVFGVGQLDSPLTVMARIPPIYPMHAKRRGIQGWVKVRFVVNENGRVDKVTVVESKPPGTFDQSVLRCVSGWRFQPGTVEGMAVRAWAETTIRFELE